MTNMLRERRARPQVGQSGGKRQRNAKPQRLARSCSHSLPSEAQPDKELEQTGSQDSSVADFRLPSLLRRSAINAAEGS